MSDEAARLLDLALRAGGPFGNNAAARDKIENPARGGAAAARRPRPAPASQGGRGNAGRSPVSGIDPSQLAALQASQEQARDRQRSVPRSKSGGAPEDGGLGRLVRGAPGMVAGLGYDAVASVVQASAFAWDMSMGLVHSQVIGAEREDGSRDRGLAGLGAQVLGAVEDHIVGPQAALGRWFQPDSGIGRVAAITPDAIDPVGSGLLSAMEWADQNLFGALKGGFVAAVSFMQQASVYDPLTGRGGDSLVEGRDAAFAGWKAREQGLRALGSKVEYSRTVDGDTVEVSLTPEQARLFGAEPTENGLYAVRLMGVDTPETTNTWLSRGLSEAEAAEKGAEGDHWKDEVASRLAPGSQITLAAAGTDAYGRLLGWVSFDDWSVNDWLIDSGHSGYEESRVSETWSAEWNSVVQDGFSPGQILTLNSHGIDMHRPETWDIPRIREIIEDDANGLFSGVIDFVAGASVEVAAGKGVGVVTRGLRHGGAVLSATDSGITLAPRIAQRSGATHATPTRALWGKDADSGLWRPNARLTPQQQQQAAILNVNRFTESKRWGELNFEMQQVYRAQERTGDPSGGTPEATELLGLRETHIRRRLTGIDDSTDNGFNAMKNWVRQTFGTQRVDDRVIRGLAQGRTPEMRTNHLRLMAGDPTAIASANTARDMYQGIIRDVYDSPVLADIDAADTKLRDHRSSLNQLAARLDGAQKTLEDLDQPETVRSTMPETIRKLEGDYFDQVQAARAVFEDKVRLETELANAVRPRDVPTDMQWDLEFLVDSELPFSPGQVRRNGVGWLESAEADLVMNLAANKQFGEVSFMMDRWLLRGMSAVFDDPRIMVAMTETQRAAYRQRKQYAGGDDEFLMDAPMPEAPEVDHSLADEDIFEVLPEDIARSQAAHEGVVGPVDNSSSPDNWWNGLFEDNDPQAAAASGSGDDWVLFVAGSRRHSDYDSVAAAMDAEVERHGGIPPRAVVHGAARGADSEAGRWAQERGVTERRFPANWSAEGRAAGMSRNRKMADALVTARARGYDVSALTFPDMADAQAGRGGTVGMEGELSRRGFGYTRPEELTRRQRVWQPKVQAETDTLQGFGTVLTRNPEADVSVAEGWQELYEREWVEKVAPLYRDPEVSDDVLRQAMAQASLRTRVAATGFPTGRDPAYALRIDQPNAEWFGVPMGDFTDDIFSYLPPETRAVLESDATIWNRLTSESLREVEAKWANRELTTVTNLAKAGRAHEYIPEAALERLAKDFAHEAQLVQMTDRQRAGDLTIDAERYPALVSEAGERTGLSAESQVMVKESETNTAEVWVGDGDLIVGQEVSKWANPYLRDEMARLETGDAALDQRIALQMYVDSKLADSDFRGDVSELAGKTLGDKPGGTHAYFLADMARASADDDMWMGAVSYWSLAEGQRRIAREVAEALPEGRVAAREARRADASIASVERSRIETLQRERASEAHFKSLREGAELAERISLEAIPDPDAPGASPEMMRLREMFDEATEVGATITGLEQKFRKLGWVETSERGTVGPATTFDEADLRYDWPDDGVDAPEQAWAEATLTEVETREVTGYGDPGYETHLGAVPEGGAAWGDDRVVPHLETRRQMFDEYGEPILDVNGNPQFFPEAVDPESGQVINQNPLPPAAQNRVEAMHMRELQDGFKGGADTFTVAVANVNDVVSEDIGAMLGFLNKRLRQAEQNNQKMRLVFARPAWAQVRSSPRRAESGRTGSEYLVGSEVPDEFGVRRIAAWERKPASSPGVRLERMEGEMAAQSLMDWAAANDVSYRMVDPNRVTYYSPDASPQSDWALPAGQNRVHSTIARLLNWVDGGKEAVQFATKHRGRNVPQSIAEWGAFRKTRVALSDVPPVPDVTPSRMLPEPEPDPVAQRAGWERTDLGGDRPEPVPVPSPVPILNDPNVSAYRAAVREVKAEGDANVAAVRTEAEADVRAALELVTEDLTPDQRIEAMSVVRDAEVSLLDRVAEAEGAAARETRRRLTELWDEVPEGVREALAQERQSGRDNMSSLTLRKAKAREFENKRRGPHYEIDDEWRGKAYSGVARGVMADSMLHGAGLSRFLPKRADAANRYSGLRKLSQLPADGLAAFVREASNWDELGQRVMSRAKPEQLMRGFNEVREFVGNRSQRRRGRTHRGIESWLLTVDQRRMSWESWEDWKSVFFRSVLDPEGIGLNETARRRVQAGDLDTNVRFGGDNTVEAVRRMGNRRIETEAEAAEFRRHLPHYPNAVRDWNTIVPILNEVETKIEALRVVDGTGTELTGYEALRHLNGRVRTWMSVSRGAHEVAPMLSETTWQPGRFSDDARRSLGLDPKQMADISGMSVTAWRSMHVAPEPRRLPDAEAVEAEVPGAPEPPQMPEADLERQAQEFEASTEEPSYEDMWEESDFQRQEAEFEQYQQMQDQMPEYDYDPDALYADGDPMMSAAAGRTRLGSGRAANVNQVLLDDMARLGAKSERPPRPGGHWFGSEVGDQSRVVMPAGDPDAPANAARAVMAEMFADADPQGVSTGRHSPWLFGQRWNTDPDAPVGHILDLRRQASNDPSAQRPNGLWFSVADREVLAAGTDYHTAWTADSNEVLRFGAVEFDIDDANLLVLQSPSDLGQLPEKYLKSSKASASALEDLNWAAVSEDYAGVVAPFDDWDYPGTGPLYGMGIPAEMYAPDMTRVKRDEVVVWDPSVLSEPRLPEGTPEGWNLEVQADGDVYIGYDGPHNEVVPPAAMRASVEADAEAAGQSPRQVQQSLNALHRLAAGAIRSQGASPDGLAAMARVRAVIESPEFRASEAEWAAELTWARAWGETGTTLGRAKQNTMIAGVAEKLKALSDEMLENDRFDFLRSRTGPSHETAMRAGREAQEQAKTDLAERLKAEEREMTPRDADAIDAAFRKAYDEAMKPPMHPREYLIQQFGDLENAQFRLAAETQWPAEKVTEFYNAAERIGNPDYRPRSPEEIKLIERAETNLEQWAESKGDLTEVERQQVRQLRAAVRSGDISEAKTPVPLQHILGSDVAADLHLISVNRQRRPGAVTREADPLVSTVLDQSEVFGELDEAGVEALLSFHRGNFHDAERIADAVADNPADPDVSWTRQEALDAAERAAAAGDQGLAMQARVGATLFDEANPMATAQTFDVTEAPQPAFGRKTRDEDVDVADEGVPPQEQWDSDPPARAADEALDPIEDEVRMSVRAAGEMEYLFNIPARRRAAKSPTGVDYQELTAKFPTRGAKIVHTFTEATPQRLIRFDDVHQSSAQFERMVRDFRRVGNALVPRWDELKKLGKNRAPGHWFRDGDAEGSMMSEAEVSDLMSRWNAMAGGDARRALFDETATELFNRFAERVGVESPAQVAKLLEDVWRGDQSKLLPETARGGMFSVETEPVQGYAANGELIRVDVPLTTRQQQSAALVPRFTLLEKAVNQGLREGWSDAGKLAEDRSVGKKLLRSGRRAAAGTDKLMSAITAVWKPMVLIRPAWPMRIIGEEALRVLSLVDMGSYLSEMLPGLGGIRDDLLRRKGLDVHGAAVRRMEERLGIGGEVADEIAGRGRSEWDVVEQYRNEHGSEAVTQEYLAAVNDEWENSRKVARPAAYGAFGWLAAGPVGALGGAAWALRSKTALQRRFGVEEAGRALAPLYRAEADRLLVEAADADPVEGAALRRAAEQIEQRSMNAEEAAEKFGFAELPRALTMTEEAQKRLADAGLEPQMIGGKTVPNAFGADVSDANGMKALVSSSRTFSQWLWSADKGRHQERMGGFGDIWKPWDLRGDAKSRANFVSAWERAVNRQFRPDDMARDGDWLLSRFWSRVDQNGNAITTADEWREHATWAVNTRAGSSAVRQLGLEETPDYLKSFVDRELSRGSNRLLPRWVRDKDSAEWKPMKQFLTDAGMPENLADKATFDHLWDRLSRGEEVSWGDVARVRDQWPPEVTNAVDAATNMNIVRGESFDSVKRTDFSWLKDKVDAMFQAFGSVPTDRLTRQPLFKARYESEMLRRMNLHWDSDKGGVVASVRQINDMAQQSRVKALGEVREYLYDLAEQTRIEEMARNLMPFYGAWAEALTRWGKIAADKPLYVGYLAHLMQEMPTGEDEHGNEIVVVPIPSPTELLGDKGAWFEGPAGGGIGVRGISDLDLTWNPQSMLLIGGLPGASPQATVLMSELVLASPTNHDALDFLFPLGYPAGATPWARAGTQATPTWLKRTLGVFAENDQMKTIQKQVFMSKMLELSELPAPEGAPQDTMAAYAMAHPEERTKVIEEVRGRARDAALLTAFASSSAPMSIRMMSPHYPLITEYDKLRDEYGGQALSVFIRKFGQQAAWSTGAMSATRSGVAPTLEAEEARESLGPLDDSDVPLHKTVMMLGVGMIGSETTKATYSAAVKAKQQSRAWGDGRERESIGLLEMMENTAVSKANAQKRNLAIERDEEVFQAGDDYDLIELIELNYAEDITHLEINNPDFADDLDKNWREDQQGMWRDLRRLAFADPEEVPAAGRPDIMLLRRVLEKRIEVERRADGRRLSPTGSTGMLWREWRGYLLDWAEQPGFEEIWGRFFSDDEIDPVTRYDGSRENLWYLDQE